MGVRQRRSENSINIVANFVRVIILIAYERGLNTDIVRGEHNIINISEHVTA